MNNWSFEMVMNNWSFEMVRNGLSAVSGIVYGKNLKIMLGPYLVVVIVLKPILYFIFYCIWIPLLFFHIHPSPSKNK